MTAKNTILGSLKWTVFGVAMSFGLTAYAQHEIKIGVVYPLTGAVASTGAELKNAVELAADIINNGAENIPNLPFAKGGGLPNLKGAKIQLVFADHQSNPQVGARKPSASSPKKK